MSWVSITPRAKLPKCSIMETFFKNDALTAKKEKKQRPKREDDSEIMVECSKCGIFISSKEAIIKDGKYYCSKECAEIK